MREGVWAAEKIMKTAVLLPCWTLLDPMGRCDACEENEEPEE